LPEPEFDELNNGMRVILHQPVDIHLIAQKLDISSRQKLALLFVEEKGKITNRDYRKIADPSINRMSASRDLQALVKLGVFEQVGENKATYYQFSKNISDFK